MPRYGLVIVKSVLFRGVQQEFSNRYHYDGAAMGQAQGTTLANNVKTIEQSLHSTDVTFLRYLVWEDTGLPGTSSMLVQGSLSGVGSGSTNASQDRERAVLVRWPAGTDSRGRPVYLRKYYHTCGAFGTVTFSAAELQNTAQISSGNRTTIETTCNGLNSVSDGTSSKSLEGPPGRFRAGTASAHKYLEHHQMGDMWRG